MINYKSKFFTEANYMLVITSKNQGTMVPE